MLRIQFGIKDTDICQDSLPNSTTLQNIMNSTNCTGRESVESGRESPESIGDNISEIDFLICELKKGKEKEEILEER